MLSQRKETAHCVNDKLERGTRTVDFNADIRWLRGGALRETRQTLWCFHGTWESSYGVGFKALVSSFNLVRAARHPQKTPPLFCSQSFRASLQSARFWDLPCGRRNTMYWLRTQRSQHVVFSHKNSQHTEEKSLSCCDSPGVRV